MKKVLTVLVLFATAVTANAQDKGKSNAFKVNLFSPIVKTGSFFYERKINEKQTAQLGVGFTSYNRMDIKITGLFFTPEYRFYVSGKAMNGFYVAPFGRYQNLKIEDNSDSAEENKAELTTIGGGVSIGRQWIFSNIITLDIFAGPSLNSGKVKITSGSDVDVPGTFQGFGARAGLTLGVAF
ncbi:MAG: DUF3575 domain-containing protein [Flavisolibacter sp.]